MMPNFAFQAITNTLPVNKGHVLGIKLTEEEKEEFQEDEKKATGRQRKTCLMRNTFRYKIATVNIYISNHESNDFNFFLIKKT